jgi:HEAT repeat protein
MGQWAATDPAVVPLLIQGLQNSDRYAPVPLPSGFVGQYGAYGQHGSRGFNGPFHIGVNNSVYGSLGGIHPDPSHNVWGGMRAFEVSSVRSESALGLRRAGPAARDAVPVLLPLLAADDDAERALPATLLGEIGPRARSAVPALRKLLKDRERGVRGAAAGALSRLDRTAVEAIPVLVEVLGEEARTELFPGTHVEALARFGKPAVPALIELLKDRHAVYRLTSPLGLTTGPEAEILAGQAAFALGEIGPDAAEALPALLDVLQDRTTSKLRDPHAWTEDLTSRVAVLELRQPPLRRSALRALGRMGSKAREAAPVLLRIARDPVESPRTRQAAVEALWRIEAKAEPLLPVGRELLSAPGNSSVDLDGFDWLSELGPSARDLMPVLIHRLEDDHLLGGRLDPARVSAASLLGKLGPVAKAAVPALQEALRSPFPELRASSAAALVRIEGKLADRLPVLLTAFQDLPVEDPSEDDPVEALREVVLAALGGIGKDAKEAVPRVRSLLAEGPLSQRILAADALWHITGETKPVLPVLQRGLESGDPATRRKAVEVLGALGPAARPAADAIKELLEDTERDVRLAAAAALKKIS